MFEWVKKELRSVTSEHWLYSIKVNKLYFIFMWCFLLPVAIIVFAFLVTDKWWVGTLLLVIVIIGCITAVLL